MAEQRVGVELFLDNDQFIANAKKSNSILIQNVKQTTKGFRSLSSAMATQTDQFEKSSAEIVDAIKKIGRESKKQEAKVTSSFTKMRGTLDKTSKAVFNVRNGFLSLGGVFVAKQVLNVADAYTLLNSRLGLVTESSEQFLSVQEDLLEIANETRQPFANTANLYTRIARAAKALNESSQDLLGVTETLNKAIIISGASLTESSAAITQFIQGIQSGTLRGQELNSVLEQTPRIAELIAEGLGVTIGELRKLGEEGQLSAQVVIDAIQSQTNAINKEFGQIETTAGQAFTVLKNEIFDVIAGTNKASGATSSLVDSIEDFTDLIRDNKGEITEFFANAVKGAKTLKPLISGVASVLAKAAEGYAKLAQVAEVASINAEREKRLKEAYDSTNRTIQQQAEIVVDLQNKVKAGTGKNAEFFASMELKRNTTLLRLAEEELTKMAKARAKLAGTPAPPAPPVVDDGAVTATVKLSNAKQELVKFENEYVDALQREYDQFQLISQVAEQAVLSQLEGRELAVQQLEFETAQLKTQANLKIENAEVLQATLTQIEENAANERFLINKEFDAKDSQNKKRKAEAERKLYFETASLAVEALNEVFGENKAFAIADIGLKTAQGIIGAFANSNPLPLQIAQAGFISAIGAAQIAKASQQKFENGGIVQGQSRTGDKIQVGANAGEMFINEQQQAKLFSMINGGGGGANITINAGVGTDLDALAQAVTDGIERASVLGLEPQG